MKKSPVYTGDFLVFNIFNYITYITVKDTA